MKPSEPASTFGRRALAVILSSLPLLGASVMAAPAAEDARVASEQEAAAAEAVTPFTPDRSLTFRELGARYPLNLRGVDASNSLPFNVRADEVVTGARVNLGYAYSPALISDLSHINVLINDEVAATIPVPKDTAGKNLQESVELPAQLVTAFNQLRLQLIGHYTLECEDPLHSSLWANISNNSKLELAVQHLALPNDLALLPLPFFDFRDPRPLTLPFVFSGQTDPQTLEAAGTLSSWFGLLAGYRGASFPASLSGVPATGNAVVLSSSPDAVRQLYNGTVTGPTVALVDNPNDPTGKLLLVLGRDSAELKKAAIALAAGNQTLTGQSAVITQFTDIKPREPYDAPKWLRTDRPVSFGELADEKRLNVSGYSPDLIRLDVRVAPDLFGWNEKKVPIDLRYRYTPQPTSVNSSLLFSVDDLFVKSMPLYSLDNLHHGEAIRTEVLPDESLPRQVKLEVPLETLNSRAQLQFRYMYDYIKQGECRDIIIDNVRGYIDPESSIDLRGYPHYKAMPDLAAFSESGWPFTRLADLSETAVFLGNPNSAEEITTYLDVLGRMGESTGYPALAVTVAGPGQLEAHADKDLLVIASGTQQPLLSQWADSLPGSYAAPDGKRFGTSDLLYRVLGWSDPDPRRNESPQLGQIAYTSDGVNAIVAGFESPLAKERSVVLVASNKPEGLEQASAAIRRVEGYDTPIQGSLSIIRGTKVDPLVGDQTYYTGSLGFFKKLHWIVAPWFVKYPWLGTLLTIIGVVLVLSLLVGLLRLIFRRRSKSRIES